MDTKIMRLAITTILGSVMALSVAHVAAEPTDAEVRPASYSEVGDDAKLVRQLARHRGGDPAALAQVIQLVRDFDDATAAVCFDELATAHVEAGKLELAAEARRMLAEQYPDSPRAGPSLLWVVRLFASGEVAHAQRRPSPGAVDLERQLAPAIEAAEEFGLTRTESADGAGGEPPASTTSANASLAAYAVALANQSIAARPALGDDPAMTYQRSAAARRAGQTKPAQGLLNSLKRRPAGDPWGDCARAEIWLQDTRAEASMKPTARCALAETPPHLDGVLDESCWQTAAAGPASDAVDVRWAYDRQFLYVAVRATKLGGVDYPQDDRPRPHDGNVEQHDRVRLLIDVDRDYATWFELVVDSRGWTADRCWGDAAWNPQWFVAAGEVDDDAGAAWTIEAAIPLAELSPDAVEPHAAWACVMQRFQPLKDAPWPADYPGKTPGPEAFKLLLFD